MRVKRNLPIGNDDFRELRENGFYYVDKTLMIRDFIENGTIQTAMLRK